MTFAIIAGAIILIGLAVAAIAWPLLKEREEGAGALLIDEGVVDPMDDLLERREAIYSAIRELRFDHQVGKVSDADYQAFDAQFKSQAVAVLKQIDALKKAEADLDLDARIEAEITALRHTNGHGPTPEQAAVAGASPQANFCPKCGNRVQSGDRFCGKCGAEVV